MVFVKKKIKKDILDQRKEDELAEGRKKEKTFSFTSTWFLALLVFLLAISVRLVFLLFFTKIDEPMVGDVWHHWQIAYLSMTVGFKHGFLRLWDFKGMEYYWGLLHPLVLIMAFTVSRSTSIIIPRIVSTLFGSGTVVLVFLIVSRYFNKKAALASALFFALMPLNVFHDTLGLQEPLGIFFLLLGIFLFYRYAFLAGFSWMLAGMTRAEYWLFGAGLVLAVLLREKNFDRKIITLFGFAVPCLLYLKYLLDYTGNPIYPIYWNFLGVVAGKWSSGLTALPLTMQPVRIFSQIFFFLFFIGGIVVLWKKFKSYLFLLLGLAYLAFAFSILGFGIYLYGYVRVLNFSGIIDKIWVGKLFTFPWAFLGSLTAIFLLYFLPKRVGKRGVLLGGLIFLFFLGATQFIWPSINQHYLKEDMVVERSQKSAELIASKYTGRGVILLPAQSEFITYFLVHNEGILGDKLAPSFYSPFYYYKGKDPFAEWDSFREEIIEWLKKQNAELFVIDIYDGNQSKMLQLEKGKLFDLVAEKYSYAICKVKINEE